MALKEYRNAKTKNVRFLPRDRRRNKKFKISSPNSFRRISFRNSKKTNEYCLSLLIYASSIKSCTKSTLTMWSREVSTWKLRPRGSGLNITVARAIYKD